MPQVPSLKPPGLPTPLANVRSLERCLCPRGPRACGSINPFYFEVLDMKSIFTRAGASSALVLSAAALVLAAVAGTQAQGQWKQLFNGKDFTGWTVPAGGGRAGATPP